MRGLKNKREKKREKDETLWPSGQSIVLQSPPPQSFQQTTRKNNKKKKKKIKNQKMPTGAFIPRLCGPKGTSQVVIAKPWTRTSLSLSLSPSLFRAFSIRFILNIICFYVVLIFPPSSSAAGRELVFFLSEDSDFRKKGKTPQTHWNPVKKLIKIEIRIFFFKSLKMLKKWCNWWSALLLLIVCARVTNR